MGTALNTFEPGTELRCVVCALLPAWGQLLRISREGTPSLSQEAGGALTICQMNIKKKAETVGLITQGGKLSEHLKYLKRFQIRALVTVIS